MEKLHSLKERTKEKVKHVFDRDSGIGFDMENGDSRSTEDTEDLFDDAAFNSFRVLEETPTNSTEKDPSTTDKTTGKLKSMASVVANPRQAMRNKATKTAASVIGSGKTPTISHARDQKYVEAYDALERAKRASPVGSIRSQRSWVDDGTVQNAEDRLRELENQRDSLATAWVMGRHVVRVKAVELPPKPQKEDFWQPCSEGTGADRFEWERYVGRFLLYHTRGFTSQYVDDFTRLPFDLRDLAGMVERLAVTSAPWQSFVLDIRRVYRWEDPARTTRWAILFWILWYYQYIGSYICAWIIFATLRNRFSARSVEQVRESLTRSLDQEANAEAWGELIQRHGKQDWIEPLLDELGPLIQLQLGDLADYLEVLQNFYRHERPDKTASSLFLLSTCLLTMLTTDMACCIKLGWGVIGGWLFFISPISARLPKYRFLCSLPRWMFWDIPTHSELAIIRLQQKAAVWDVGGRDASDNETRLDSHSSDESEYESCNETMNPKNARENKRYTFRVFHKDHLRSRLVISREGVEFRTPKNALEFYNYQNISEIRKVDIDSKFEKATAMQYQPEGLQLICTNTGGQHELTFIVRRADRDKIFNLILAWSGRKWQALQMNRFHSIQDDKSRLQNSIKRAVA